MAAGDPAEGVDHQGDREAEGESGRDQVAFGGHGNATPEEDEDGGPEELDGELLDKSGWYFGRRVGHGFFGHVSLLSSDRLPKTSRVTATRLITRVGLDR